MPTLLVPNSASLAEYNPCHNPGGPGGGQFCRRNQGTGVSRRNPEFPFGRLDVPLKRTPVPEGVLQAGEIDAARKRISKVPPEVFKAAISNLKGRARKSAVSDYSVEDLGTMKLFLLKGRQAGYAIKGGDELVNLFNAGGLATLNSGQWLVLHAIEQGARRLDCFDNGYLVKFYTRLGFKETRREANWTPGEPDVVFMEWHGGDIKTARSRFNLKRSLDIG